MNDLGVISFFLGGIATCGFAAAGVFFLKFWKASKDSFFLFFAIACWMMATERIINTIVCEINNVNFVQPPEGILFYLVRLLAFVIIFVAVLRKNRSS